MTKQDFLREFFQSHFNANPGAEVDSVVSIFLEPQTEQENLFRAYLTAKLAELEAASLAVEDKYEIQKQNELASLAASMAAINAILNEEQNG